jgi:hypothetical protein
VPQDSAGCPDGHDFRVGCRIAVALFAIFPNSYQVAGAVNNRRTHRHFTGIPGSLCQFQGVAHPVPVGFKIVDWGMGHGALGMGYGALGIEAANCPGYSSIHLG